MQTIIRLTAVCRKNRKTKQHKIWYVLFFYHRFALVATVMQAISQGSSCLTACEERLLGSCIARGQHNGAVGGTQSHDSRGPGSNMGLGYGLTGFLRLPKSCH